MVQVSIVEKKNQEFCAFGSFNESVFNTKYDL